MKKTVKLSLDIERYPKTEYRDAYAKLCLKSNDSVALTCELTPRQSENDNQARSIAMIEHSAFRLVDFKQPVELEVECIFEVNGNNIATATMFVQDDYERIVIKESKVKVLDNMFGSDILPYLALTDGCFKAFYEKEIVAEKEVQLGDKKALYYRFGSLVVAFLQSYKDEELIPLDWVYFYVEKDTTIEGIVKKAAELKVPFEPFVEYEQL